MWELLGRTSPSLALLLVVAAPTGLNVSWVSRTAGRGEAYGQLLHG